MNVYLTASFFFKRLSVYLYSVCLSHLSFLDCLSELVLTDLQDVSIAVHKQPYQLHCRLESPQMICDGRFHQI